MALPNASMDFTPFDILTAAELDDLVENDQALAAGTGLNASAVTYDKVANGFAIQTVTTTTTAVATGTTLFAFDDNPRVITEGTEFMTLAITPKATTNTLIIQVIAMLQHSVSTDLVGAIFQDATTNAKAAISQNDTASGRNGLKVVAVVTAGTTSSTTFRFRGGGSNAGTTTFNGNGGTRLHGATPKSMMMITEIKA